MMDIRTFRYVTRVLWILSACLQLLPPEQLEHLDVRVNGESESPVKKVVYMSNNSIPYVEANATILRQRSEGTRFNLFTGNQTFDQRQKSFKVMNCNSILFEYVY